jgi:ribosomal protein S12 methylthiotransferase
MENARAIMELEELKNYGVIRKIIVTGCLYNRYGKELQSEFPDVDFWARSEDWSAILNYLNEEVLIEKEIDELFTWPRGLLKEHYVGSRYLKISEGCDSFCSYCTIPLIRGRAKSFPIEQLTAEAVKLCECGAKELCVISQDTTAYGKDIYGETKLEELLDELEKNTPDDIWIRLLYLHPDRITHKLIDKVAGSKKILPYLDVPIQHISDQILQNMNRFRDALHIKDIFRYAREVSPLFALRTTFMVGFPGETEEHFRHILDFMEEIQLDRV